MGVRKLLKVRVEAMPPNQDKKKGKLKGISLTSYMHRKGKKS